jgi:hypothetical protein
MSNHPFCKEHAPNPDPNCLTCQKYHSQTIKERIETNETSNWIDAAVMLGTCSTYPELNRKECPCRELHQHDAQVVTEVIETLLQEMKAAQTNLLTAPFMASTDAVNSYFRVFVNACNRLRESHELAYDTTGTNEDPYPKIVAALIATKALQGN